MNLKANDEELISSTVKTNAEEDTFKENVTYSFVFHQSRGKAYL